MCKSQQKHCFDIILYQCYKANITKCMHESKGNNQISSDREMDIGKLKRNQWMDFNILALMRFYLNMDFYLSVHRCVSKEILPGHTWKGGVQGQARDGPEYLYANSFFGAVFYQQNHWHGSLTWKKETNQLVNLFFNKKKPSVGEAIVIFLFITTRDDSTYEAFAHTKII